MNVWPRREIHQGLLETHLCNLFPQYTTIKNVRKGVEIKNPQTGAYFEVDVWFPELNLCFEFQDDYHFRPAWYAQRPLQQVQLIDSTKKRELLMLQQTLIVVPYWWDGKLSSLKGTIHFHRPDLATPHTNIIPSNPSVLFVAGYKILMLAAFPDSNKLDNNLWWVGEKWDGVRCYWNLHENILYSRQHISIDLGVSMNELLGQLILDGELWCGRASFLEAQNVVLSPWESSNNALLRLVCFDEASTQTNHSPFETRYSIMLSHLHASHPFAINAPRFICSSEEGLMASLQSVLEGGGEGLIVRKPLSRYLPGKSDSLFKIKASHSDQEALVVKVEQDNSLLLRLPNGSALVVPKQDIMLHRQAVRGDIVTFRFDFTSRRASLHQTKHTPESHPANPIVHRIRNDLSWEDVTGNPSQQVRKFGNEPHQSFTTAHAVSTPLKKLTESETAGKSNSWKSCKERRSYFDQYAASKGADPLNPVFWYNVTAMDISRFRIGFDAIAEYYGGGLAATLMQIYPDIGLQISNFNVGPSRKTRLTAERAYFDAYAASKGKNPLSPHFWYSVSKADLSKTHQTYRRIISGHGGKLPSTLTKLYPDIKFQQSRFKSSRSWKLPRDRRAYFDKFASSKGMDPLNPTFWYNITVPDVVSYHKGYYGIRQYYGNTLSSTIMNLYPDIGLQKSAFKVCKN